MAINFPLVITLTPYALGCSVLVFLVFHIHSHSSQIIFPCLQWVTSVWLSKFSLYLLVMTCGMVCRSVMPASLWPHGLYSSPSSSVYGILQARIPEWVAMPFSRGSSQPRDRTWVSCIAGRFFTVWATSKAPKGRGKWNLKTCPWCELE